MTRKSTVQFGKVPYLVVTSGVVATLRRSELAVLIVLMAHTAATPPTPRTERSPRALPDRPPRPAKRYGTGGRLR